MLVAVPLLEKTMSGLANGMLTPMSFATCADLDAKYGARVHAAQPWRQDLHVLA